MKNGKQQLSDRIDHSLNGLDSLTDRLPPLTELVSTRLGRTIEYKMELGTCFGIGLLNQPDVAVQKCFISKGSKFPSHSHPEVEILIVFHGDFQVYSSSYDKRLGVGDIVRFAPGEEHSCEAITDSWVIGITIPRSEGYPAVP